MSDYSTRATVRLEVNGQAAKNALAELDGKAKLLREDLAKAQAEGNNLKMAKLQKEIAKVDKQIDTMRASTERANRVLRNLDKATPKELRATMALLKKDLDHLERGSTAWNKQQAAIRAVKEQIQMINDEQKKGLSLGERMNDWFNKWQTAILGAVGAMAGFVMAGRKAVAAFGELDTAMADTRKFTGIAGDDLVRLNEELMKLETRTSLIDLHKLAQEAGRLGKDTVESVVGYVTAADQLNVALDDLGEGATQAMAKVTEIFGVETEMGTEASLLAVGSTINELSQNCSAGMSYLSDFTNRMAGVGAQAKMTVPEIMAFAAVLDTQGQQVEASATALQKLILDVNKDPGKFAKALGVSLDELRSKFSNTTEGLVWLFETMHDTGGIDKIAPLLADMGENGARASSTFAALANKVDFLKQQIKAANSAFSEATSVTNEYNIVQSTFEAQLDKAKKRSQALAVELGEKLAPVMMLVHSSSYYALRVLRVLVDFFYNYKSAIVAVTAAIVAYNAVTKAQIVLAGIRNGLAKTGELIAKGYTATVKALTAAKIALSHAMAVLQGNWAKQSSLMLDAKNLGMSLTKGYALLAAAIAAIGVAVYTWYQRTQQQLKAQRELKELEHSITADYRIQETQINRLVAAINSENTSNDARALCLKRLQEITGLENLALDKHNKLTKEGTAAINAYLKALGTQIRARALEDKLVEFDKKVIDLENKRDEQAEKLNNLKVEQAEIGATSPTPHPGSVNIATMEAGRKVRAAARDLKDANKELNEAVTVRDALVKKLGEANSKLITVPTSNASAVPNVSAPTLPASSPTPAAKSTPAKATPAPAPSETYLQKRTKAYESATLALKVQYAKGVKDFETYTEEMAALEKSYYDDVTTNAKIPLEERNKLFLEYDKILKDRQREADAKSQEERLQAEEEFYSSMRRKGQESYLEGWLDKTEYDEYLEQLELEHLKRMLDVYEAGSAEHLKAEEDYNNAVIADRERRLKRTKELQAQEQAEEEKRQKELSELRDEYFGPPAGEQRKTYERMMTLLDQVYEQEITAAGNNADEKLRIEEAFQKAKVALAKKYGQLGETENQTFLQNFNDSVQEFFKSDLGEAITKGVSTLSSSMDSIFQQVTSLITAEAEIATNKVNALYEKQISLAEGNTYKTAALEKEQAAKVAKIKNDAEKKKYKMQIVSAIAQTATAAINAYSSAAQIPFIGWNILGPLAASMAIAAGMLQVAAIKKQAQASASQGYAEGGYTGSGGKYQVAGVVHAGEWVASQRLLADPSAGAIVGVLDDMQRRRSYGRLSGEDVSRSITSGQELAMLGGGDLSRTMTEQVAAMAHYASVIERLNQRLDEPFVTVNTVSGDHGIRRAEEKYDRLLKNKSKKS